MQALENNQMFKVGQMAVHPAHGVGEVSDIEERELGGRKSPCYVLKMLGSGLKVMVPTDAATRVGLPDLGTGSAYTLRAPRIALLMGEGIYATSAGAHWCAA